MSMDDYWCINCEAMFSEDEAVVVNGTATCPNCGSDNIISPSDDGAIDYYYDTRRGT